MSGVPRMPVQDESRGTRRGAKPPGSVTWAEHFSAWCTYTRRHPGQDAVTIAVRGGFGFWELTDLLGYEPRTWQPGAVDRPQDATLRATLTATTEGAGA